jgi:hypothetical protein
MGVVILLVLLGLGGFIGFKSWDRDAGTFDIKKGFAAVALLGAAVADAFTGWIDIIMSSF